MSIFIVVAVVIVLANLAALLKAIKRAKTAKKTLIHVKNAPKFSPNLLDCYVKFKGQVKPNNNSISPLTQTNCAFYSYFVIAHWTHKKKKPEKGTEPQKRLLLQDKSADTLELVHESGHIVKLRWEDFLKLDKFHYWHTNKQKTAVCPSTCQALAEARFEQYESIENYVLADEEVMVYGKLIRESNGDLCIIHSKINQFPSTLKLASSRSSILTSMQEEFIAVNRKRNLHVALLFVFSMIAIAALAVSIT